MLEPLCHSLTFEQCVQALADALKVDLQPRSLDERLLLVHYFAALVIGGRMPVWTHDGLGNTALHYAARIGWPAGVSSIISSGAFQDLEAKDDEAEEEQRRAATAVLSRNSSGCSALHCACVSGCLQTLHMLLQTAGSSLQDAAATVDDTDNDAERRTGGAHTDSEDRTLLHYAGAPPTATIIIVQRSLLADCNL